MQKKTLLGGLLLCSAFLFTSCDKIMSQFDNAVDSHLVPADKLTVIGVGDTYTIAKDVDYATISDAAPKFESQTPAIATVDPKTGVVTALRSGDAKIKISLPDNGLYLDASAIIDIKVRVQNYNQLKKNIEDASTTEKTTISLDGSKTIEVTANLKLQGKEIEIEGNGATIKTASSFLISKSFTLSNVKIDIDPESTKQLICLDSLADTKKNQSVYTDAEQKNINLLDEISIKNVMVKNLQNSLIYENKQNWALSSLNIENCIIQFNFDTDKTIIDFYTSWVKSDANKPNQGAIKNINIINNTFYNVKANSKSYFFRLANASNASGTFGTKNGTSTYDWNISNNTFVRTQTGKDFGNNIVNNGKVKNTMNNNIFYDVYRIYQWLLTSQIRETVGNFAFYDVTKASDCTNDQSRKDNNDNPYTTKLTSAPFTCPTEAIDLTKENGGLNLKPSGDAKDAGDPRWRK